MKNVKFTSSLCECEIIYKPYPIGKLLDTTALVFDFARTLFPNDEKEHFFIIMCNTKLNVKAVHHVAMGCLDSCITHPREIFRPAIIAGAASIFLVHNHNSNSAAPSPQDREITKQLRKIGELVKIPIRDHIIISNSSYYSFAQVENWE